VSVWGSLLSATFVASVTVLLYEERRYGCFWEISCHKDSKCILVFRVFMSSWLRESVTPRTNSRVWGDRAEGRRRRTALVCH
jgi:hypothetical protein